MAARIRAIGSAKPRITDVEKLSAQVAQLEIEHADSLADCSLAERTLQEAMLLALDGGDEGGVETARKALRRARENAGDLAQLVSGLQAKRDRARHNHEAQLRASQVAAAQDAAAAMTAALKGITGSCDHLAKHVRDFYAARERFFEHAPIDMKPAHIPPLWTNLDRFVERYVGARCPVHRGSAAATGNVEYLATVNEPLLLHLDALTQIFPDEPPPQAA